ncbi:hypothetical protein [Massilia sp. S19_KUP03_FR1]|uniref:hypothetical protein n=1 Tax=Massilia sp. S19_KUP03_FR1 TaxID=3025503 RepID=UPI002FCDE092
MKNRLLFAATLAAALLLGWYAARYADRTRDAQAQQLQSLVTTTQQELAGHTSYTSYLTAGKQTLGGQVKLLTATLVREEGLTQIIHRTILPHLGSSGTVAIWYAAEYAFGFDLRPDQFELRATSSGIEVRVKKPALVATPAVSKLTYKVLEGGVLVDEKAAVLKLYEEAAGRARRQGAAMASDPAVVALCEKKLLEFLYGFIEQQPGVKVVPRITVVYR